MKEDATRYEHGPIEGAIGARRIDLLIVDGPPAYQVGRHHRRYPAVPYFHPKLADDYIIVLDDIHRPGEQDILDAWERRLGITFERGVWNGRVGVGRSRDAYSV